MRNALNCALWDLESKLYESVHDRTTLDALVGRYDIVNIKLDKTGGLTESLVIMDQAQAAGFDIMVGSTVSTSLRIAPAML